MTASIRISVREAWSTRLGPLPEAVWPGLEMVCVHMITRGRHCKVVMKKTVASGTVVEILGRKFRSSADYEEDRSHRRSAPVTEGPAPRDRGCVRQRRGGGGAFWREKG